MVEHIAWIGPDYAGGILGQKVAVVGYSHWGDRPDHNGFTNQCVANVRDSIWPDISFFNRLQTFFGFVDSVEFWNSVMFFNFVPSFVGGRDQRYAWATHDQKEAGQARTLRLIQEYRPDKLLVFSRKSWTSFPPTVEEQAGLNCAPLGNGCAPAFTYGTYPHYPSQGTSTIAVGLRHPQYASTLRMQAAVSTAMALGR